MNQTQQIQRAAESYFDKLHAENEAAAEKVECATDAIRTAFKAHGPIPYTTTRNGNLVLQYMTFQEAVMGLIDYDEVATALIEALKTSECPKVKRLNAALVSRHIHMNADELGELL